MPKHFPTFKHLLHTSQTPQKDTQPAQKSVNDLLSSSRTARQINERDAPPHITATGAGESSVAPASGLGPRDRQREREADRVWAPSAITGSNSGAGAGGLVEVEDGGIHPAELLRRQNISNRQASRSVAGPAPPPSWRPSSSTAASSAATIHSNKSSTILQNKPVSTAQLLDTYSLLSTGSAEGEGSGRRRPGVGTLMEFCFRTVLRHMEDDQIIYDPSSESQTDIEREGSASRVDGIPGSNNVAVGTGGDERNPNGSDGVYTLGRLLREQVTYLSPHLKPALLHSASVLPSSHPSRLTDRSMLAVLSEPPPDASLETDDPPGYTEGESTSVHVDGPGRAGDEREWDWDDTSLDSSLITALPLPLHPSPHNILRSISIISSLTSLNLGYCTLPSDLERLVAVLPPGLRELSLVGARIGSGKRGMSADEDVLRRGFGALGRKLIVLKTLDLSFTQFEMTPRILSSLLLPPNTKLPSLRTLGMRMRGHTTSSDTTQTPFSQTTGDLDGLSIDSGHDHIACTGSSRRRASIEELHAQTVSSEDGAECILMRKSVLDIVRSGGRKYVEVVW